MNKVTLQSIMLSLAFFAFSCTAQKTVSKETTNTVTKSTSTIVTAENSDLADNLDLEAVASIFSTSKDLEDFEKQLNDPDKEISNLDLDMDGNVDYLRVIEEVDGNTHSIHVQSVLGKDSYQNVAELVVTKTETTETQVEIVGDPYVYGPDYIIQPVYNTPPIMFGLFFSGFYSPWRSPFYWGVYPHYYRPRRPYPPHIYHNNVHIHVNGHNHYRHTNVRRSPRVTINNNNVHVNHNHMQHSRPQGSYQHRNPSYQNHQSRQQSRGSFNAPHRSYHGSRGRR